MITGISAHYRASSLWVYGTAFLLTLAGAVAFSVMEPYPAVRGSTPLDQLTPWSYQFLIFFPFGILIAEISAHCYHSGSKALWTSNAIQFLMLCLTALTRLMFYIPISGHALLIGYYLPHQLFFRREKSFFRIGVGAALTAHIAYYKLWVWKDFITFPVGLGAGAAIWGMGKAVIYYRQRHSGFDRSAALSA